MPWSQHPAGWLWAPPLPLSALQFIPVYMLKLAAAECVSELDERRHEWMEAWVDGGMDRRACIAVAWLLPHHLPADHPSMASFPSVCSIH